MADKCVAKITNKIIINERRARQIFKIISCSSSLHWSSATTMSENIMWSRCDPRNILRQYDSIENGLWCFISFSADSPVRFSVVDQTDSHSYKFTRSRSGPPPSRQTEQICVFIKLYWNNKIWQPHSVRRRVGRLPRLFSTCAKLFQR